MTQSDTLSEPLQAATNGFCPPNLADSLLRLLVNLLAPMFLLGSDGDIQSARLAALGTINAYRARNEADLLSVAQLIAFGLATLGSLSLSMADDLPLNMVLRLRGNANACNRSAEQHRRALQQSRPAADSHANPAERPRPTPPARQAAQPQTQTAAPASPAMPQNPPHQAIWAAAMVTVAEEYAAEFPNLPPEERELAARRADALNYCINEFLAGSETPPGPAATAPPRP